uniref:Uncharacterized protein n=1 Tax=Rhizophora mucronata TaxID=61149 RepID=A0A2P2Q3S6_RHIMU
MAASKIYLHVVNSQIISTNTSCKMHCRN